ncbi:unnamed protein product [Danaus chrysippus]|uniref:(African queen) hypothetical protein n=1 Tax=Danaus chrysippus TaxID=151541 RepID=A0A8J2QIC4_9NEOP|nr:unnamed protein product [Danaus chrysippus]
MAKLTPPVSPSPKQKETRRRGNKQCLFGVLRSHKDSPRPRLDTGRSSLRDRPTDSNSTVYSGDRLPAAHANYVERGKLPYGSLSLILCHLKLVEREALTQEAQGL